MPSRLKSTGDAVAYIRAQAAHDLPAMKAIVAHADAEEVIDVLALVINTMIEVAELDDGFLSMVQHQIELEDQAGTNRG